MAIEVETACKIVITVMVLVKLVVSQFRSSGKDGRQHDGSGGWGGGGDDWDADGGCDGGWD
jgi:hypothetical protein